MDEIDQLKEMIIAEDKDIDKIRINIGKREEIISKKEICLIEWENKNKHIFDKNEEEHKLQEDKNIVLMEEQNNIN